MKHLQLFLICLVSISSMQLKANSNDSTTIAILAPLADLDDHFTEAEFTGGQQAFDAFVALNRTVAAASESDGVIVSLECYISETGEIAYNHTINAVDEACEKDAIGIISKMPKWIPATDNGKPCLTYQTVQMDFSASVIQILHPRSEPKSGSASVSYPEFSGGEEAMWTFLHENMTYPSYAYKQVDLYAEATFGFIVEKDGKLKDFKILKGIEAKLDQELLKVVKSMPDWKPASYYTGERVATFYSLNLCLVPRVLEEATDLSAAKYSWILHKFPMPISISEILGNEEEIEGITIYDLEETKFVIYSNPEVEASFPGGEEALKEFLSLNLYYPARDVESDVVGGVQLRFELSNEGDISNISVIKGLSPLCDQEALRLVRAMPSWEPAMEDGEKVFSIVSLIVNFDSKSISEPKLSSTDSDYVSMEELHKAQVLRYGVKDDALTQIQEVIGQREEEREDKEEQILTYAEYMPEFPGGKKAMMSFIAEHLQMPESAVAYGIQGKVFLRFVVAKDGSIDDVRVMRGVCPEYDAEAVRVVKLMPRWVAGSQNRKKVSVYYTLPILFKIG